MSTKILIGIPSYTGNLPLKLVSRLLHLELKEDYEITFAFTEHTFIEKARNSIAKKCVENGFDYLFFIDDDTVPSADVLIKMIELDKDIVCPPVLDRNGEKSIALFDENLEKLTELTETKKVGAGGMSSTLIKVEVLKKMFEKYERPFQFQDIDIKGKLHHMGEDVNFCWRAKELGFETWAIHTVRPIHIGSAQVFQYSPEGQDQTIHVNKA